MNDSRHRAATLTTTAGNPVADNQDSLSAGPRGPLLLQDYQLIEKLAHQNRERIPERVVHAKGCGAYGTLIITGNDFPPIDIGILELNRNALNYFAEVEQVAMSPSNIVPGIGFSPDKVLQARIFSYADAHRYRLGTHYEALPVNAPRCPVHHYHKDGAMRFFRNDTGNPDAYYEPNSVGGPKEAPHYREPPLKIGDHADRYSHRDGNDDYTQPGNLFRLFDSGQKQRLFDNIAAAMRGVPEVVQRRQIALFFKCDPDYGQGVAKSLRLTDHEPAASPSDPLAEGMTAS